MIKYISLLCSFPLLAFSWVALQPNPSLMTPINGQEHLIYSGKFVDIYVDKTLYEQDGSPYFFNRFNLINKSGNPIFIGLDDYWNCIYPNQWGIHRQDHRMVIDESRINPQALNKEAEKKLKTDFKNNKSAQIPVAGSISYFREFNASGRKDIKLPEKEFLIISFDGQLYATDGKSTEHIHFGLADAEVAWSYPLVWDKIPQDAQVINYK